MAGLPLGPIAPGGSTSNALDIDGLLNRVNRLEGQVRGVCRMLNERRACIEVMQQLAAAEAALGRIGLALFKDHIERCVQPGLAKGPAERNEELKGLSALVDRLQAVPTRQETPESA